MSPFVKVFCMLDQFSITSLKVIQLLFFQLFHIDQPVAGPFDGGNQFV